jgi:hypothetical protein
MLLQITKFDQSPWPRILAPLLAGLALAAACHEVRAAPEARRPVYVIADNEGYGLVECISQKRECGKIVADSWCEAHGHGPALFFGGAEDVTGAIETTSDSKKLEGAVVTCAD